MIIVRLTNAADIWLTDDSRCRVTNPNSRFSEDEFVTEAPLATACDMLDLHLVNALLHNAGIAHIASSSHRPAEDPDPHVHRSSAFQLAARGDCCEGGIVSRGRGTSASVDRFGAAFAMQATLSSVSNSRRAK
jgi:hypothetical protein